MISIWDAYSRLKDNEFSNITLTECEWLVDIFPETVAEIIKSLREEKSKCELCGIENNKYRQCITFESMFKRVCGNCYEDWYYRR